MLKTILAAAGCALLAACATAPEVSPAVSPSVSSSVSPSVSPSVSTSVSPSVSNTARSELAPSGIVRIGVNFQNVLLTRKDPVSGEAGGIALDLAHELGRRLGVPVQIVPFKTAGHLADAVSTGEWDVAFLAAEPQRAAVIAFTAPYLEIETTYLVPPGSPFRRVEDVDREGVRVAAGAKGGPDLAASRTLKRAQIVRAPTTPAAAEMFVKDKLDALVGLRPRLVEDAKRLPGSRILEGRLSVVGQAVGTHKGREAGARYLAAFVEDIKASGLVARVIEKNGMHGVTVAPPAGQ